MVNLKPFCKFIYLIFVIWPIWVSILNIIRKRFQQCHMIGKQLNSHIYKFEPFSPTVTHMEIKEWSSLQSCSLENLSLVVTSSLVDDRWLVKHDQFLGLLGCFLVSVLLSVHIKRFIVSCMWNQCLSDYKKLDGKSKTVL